MKYDARIHIKVKRKGEIKLLTKIKVGKYGLISNRKTHVFDIDETDFCVDGDWACNFINLNEFVGKIGTLLKPIEGIVIAESINYSVSNDNYIIYDFGSGLRNLQIKKDNTNLSIINLEQFITKKIPLEKLNSGERNLLNELGILNISEAGSKQLLKKEKDVLLKNITKRNNLFALKHASIELRNDKEVVLAAVNAHGYGQLCYADKELLNNKKAVLEFVRIHGMALSLVSKELKNDKEVVLEAVREAPGALEYASKELKNDKEVVLEAINKSGYALLAASNKLKKDKELAIASVKQLGKFDAVLDVFKDDKDVVLVAVSVNGKSLRNASKRLKDDKEVVLAAIENNKEAIKYASKRLQEEIN